MKAGSMEGLIGAVCNLKMAETPMRVFCGAERRGDLGTMERAMGYVTHFEGRAQDYRKKAGEELEKEQKEEREELETKREEAVQRRREEKKAPEEQSQEKGDSEFAVVDSVEISEEGKRALKQSQTEETGGAPEQAEVFFENSGVTTV